MLNLSGQEKTQVVHTVVTHLNSGARFAGFRFGHLLVVWFWTGVAITPPSPLQNSTSSLWLSHTIFLNKPFVPNSVYVSTSWITQLTWLSWSCFFEMGTVVMLVDWGDRKKKERGEGGRERERERELGKVQLKMNHERIRSTGKGDPRDRNVASDYVLCIGIILTFRD